MKKTDSKTRKGIIIVVLWLAFLAAAAMIIFRIEVRLCSDATGEDLKREAKSISLLLPVLEENNQYAKESVGRGMPARMNALAIGLEKYENMEDARQFLEEFRNLAGLENLVVYDARGRVVYGDGDFAKELNLGAEEIRAAIKDGKKPDDPWTAAASVADRWLAVGRMAETSAQKDILDFFDLRSGLAIITNDGRTSAVGIDLEDGQVLFAPDSGLVGRSMEEAEFRKPDGTAFADAAELKEYFKEPEQTKRIRMNGVSYDAVRTGGTPEELLLLVMIPETQVKSSARNIMIPLFLIILLVSGLYSAWAVFRIPEHLTTDGFREYKNYVWNRKLAANLRTASLIAVLAVLGFTIYSEILMVYSSTLISNRERIEHALTLYDDNHGGAAIVKNWSDEEYLTRTWIAQCILANRDGEEITREELAELGEALDVQAISLYDRDGGVQVTGSPYLQPSIGENSPFYPLLQGRKTEVGTPEEDEVTGTVIRKIGIGVRDENGNPDGCILVSEDLDEQLKLNNVTRYEYLFRQLAAPADTHIAAAGQENNEILYLGTALKEGYEEYRAEDSNLPPQTLQDLGIREDQLQDSFNGSVAYENEDYVLSVRPKEDVWLVLMQKLDWVTQSMIRLVIGNVLAILAYTVIVTVICCREKKSALTEPTAEDGTEEELPRRGLDVQAFFARHGDPLNRRKEIFAGLGDFLYIDKPYFEERWPDESKKWSDKSPEEKYRVVSRTVFIFFMIALIFQALTIGEDSMLAISLRGEWNYGFNLHSVTTILFMICLLITARILIHKILYLLARAASSRGETICHFLDSHTGYALVMIGFFIGLSQLGFDTAQLSLSAGVVGVILGFGGANLVSDILAGIVMAFEGSVRVGDIVYYEDTKYIVVSIGFRTTKLKHYGKTTIIRNDDFRNVAKVPAKGMVEVDACFRTDLSESVTRVEETLTRELPEIHETIIRRIKNVEGPFYWGVDEISDGWMEFCVYLNCEGEDFSEAQVVLNAEIMKMCERNAIRMPAQAVMLYDEHEN